MKLKEKYGCAPKDRSRSCDVEKYSNDLGSIKEIPSETADTP